MEKGKEQYSVEDIRRRFQQTPILREFLPMLDEYIFSPARVQWLCTASDEEVFGFCFAVDE